MVKSGITLIPGDSLLCQKAMKICGTIIANALLISFLSIQMCVCEKERVLNFVDGAVNSVVDVDFSSISTFPYIAQRVGVDRKRSRKICVKHKVEMRVEP